MLYARIEFCLGNLFKIILITVSMYVSVTLASSYNSWVFVGRPCWRESQTT